MAPIATIATIAAPTPIIPCAAMISGFIAFSAIAV
jgi:hypothetical protein